MKCPLKFGRFRFEGGEECEPECAWRMGAVTVIDGESTLVDVCAFAASKVEYIKCGIVNWEEHDG